MLGFLSIFLLTSWTLSSDSVSEDSISDVVSEAEPTQNITRSRRQTVKTLPRLPRQIFRSHNPFPGTGGFVHFGGLAGATGGRGGEAGVVLPPITLPPRGPRTMIQATQAKLIDSVPRSVNLQMKSDQFGHQHRIEDGRGNFQFFQIGKSEKPSSIGSLRLSPITPTFFPTPVPFPQQSQSLSVTPAPIVVAAATPDSRFFTSFSESSPSSPPPPSFSPTMPPSSFSGSPSTAPSSPTPGPSVAPASEEPRQGRQFSFSPTPVPVRGLPPMARPELRPMVRPPQPSQPPSLPFHNGANRFGFSSLQFPNNRPVQASNSASGQLPSFFSPFSGQSTFPGPGQSSVFLGQSPSSPANVARLAAMPPRVQRPFRAPAPVPKQFMPIRAGPRPRVAATRHLAEPRVISTSRPRSQEQEAARTQGQGLLSFNELRNLQTLASTSTRGTTTTRRTTTTTTKRTTTRRKTTTTRRTTTPRRPSASPQSKFQIFSATMRPIIQQEPDTSISASPGQFMIFPSASPDNGKSPPHQPDPLSEAFRGSSSLFAPINSGFRPHASPSPLSGGVNQAESRQPVSGQTNIPSTSGIGDNLRGLHVFSRPSILDREPLVFRGTRPSLTEPPRPSGQTFLAGTPASPVRVPAAPDTSPIPGLATDILSSFSQEQLEALRHQLTVSFFPHAQAGAQAAPLTGNFVAKQNIDNSLGGENLSFDNQFSQNFLPIIQQPQVRPTTTITTQATTTTTKSSRRPMNFRLKNRERRIRNRNRARNPNLIRLTTTKTPLVQRQEELPQKPNLFNPFSNGANDDTANSNLQLSPQNFAQHPQSVTKFSQEKLNAFANLLAVAHDDVQTSTEKSSIGSVSLGEGGFMAHTDAGSVETVTSHKVNQFEFFTPKSEGGAEFRGLSTTMIPAFDDDFPNFVLVSSTHSPISPQSSRPLFDVSTDPTLEFAPTPMTTLDDSNLHVFSIQSTIQPHNSFEPTPQPPLKKIRFKPTTTKHRQFQFPKEAFEEDNSIQDFTPKFFVDPGMKEKFAIIKVKNHNAVERVRSSGGSLITTTIATTSGEDKTTAPANFITTLAARRNRLLKKEKNSLRRRKVKRVKGHRRLKADSKIDENTLRGRKRLPLIRKSASTTSFSSTTSVVQTTSSTSEKRGTQIDTTTPVSTTLSPERSSKRFRIFNSGKIPEAHLNQISEEGGNQKQEATPDARVIELTNNILELKEKLELLKKELDM